MVAQPPQPSPVRTGVTDLECDEALLDVAIVVAQRERAEAEARGTPVMQLLHGIQGKR